MIEGCKQAQRLNNLLVMGTILEEDLTINPATNPLSSKNIEDNTDLISDDSDINQASTSSCD